MLEDLDAIYPQEDSVFPGSGLHISESVVSPRRRFFAIGICVPFRRVVTKFSPLGMTVLCVFTGALSCNLLGVQWVCPHPLGAIAYDASPCYPTGFRGSVASTTRWCK